MTSSAPASTSVAERGRHVVVLNRRRLAGRQALTGTLSNPNEQTGAALHVARIPLSALACFIDAQVQLGEAIGHVAVAVVPRVPPVDVRERHREEPRAVAADHQRCNSSRPRENDGVVEAVEAAREGHALSG
jgi:hypothetical protein